VNSDSAKGEFVVRMAQPARLRFVNIRPESNATSELLRDSLPGVWRPVAKDGFARVATRRPAAASDGAMPRFDPRLPLADRRPHPLFHVRLQTPAPYHCQAHPRGANGHEPVNNLSVICTWPWNTTL
jgi:hypothetical protein